MQLPPMTGNPVYGRFGRFGRFHDDGLLTVDISPRGFSYPDCLPGFQVRWGEPSAPLAAVVPRLDPTEKRLAIQGGGEGAPHLVRYSLLFPGVAAWFGKRMVLHFTDRANRPLKCAIDPSRFKSGDGILVIPGDRFPASPLLVIPPKQAGLRVWYDGANLTVEGPEDLGEVRFITITGIGTVPTLRSAWRQAAALRDLPVASRKSMRTVVDENRNVVVVTEVFDTDMAPVSPLLAHAVDAGYPASFDGDLVRSGVLTRWGEFVWIAGSRASATLPLPPLDARGLLRPRTTDPRRQSQSEALLKDTRPSSPGATATAEIEELVALQRAQSLLPAEVSSGLEARWRTLWNNGLRQELWRSETEPITGHSYIGTGAVSGDRNRPAGLGTGAARVSAAIGTYVRWQGDWDFARQQAASLSRYRRYAELAEDWVWMAPAETDHGAGTGDGESMGLLFAAAMAERFLARGLGDSALESRAAVRCARLAVALVARFHLETYARQTRQTVGKTTIVGYHENLGYVTAPTSSGDPALAATVLGDVCSQDDLARLYGAFCPDALRVWFDSVAAERPRWYDPADTPLQNTRHRGNSLRVVGVHLFQRWRVLGEGVGYLGARWDKALGNRFGGRSALPLLAEWISKDVPVVLVDWGPLGYRDGIVDENGTGATLTFVSEKPAPWRLTLETRPGCVVRTATIAGKPAGLEGRGNRWVVVGDVPQGTWKVQLDWSKPAAPPAAILSPGPAPKGARPGMLDLAPGKTAW